MDENYVTYVDDEHVDNHDYDDNTDDDHDNNNDLYGRACNARVNTSIYIYIYMSDRTGQVYRHRPGHKTYKITLIKYI